MAEAGARDKKSVVALKYVLDLLQDLEPETRLPSEREIAETLGMTRSPVHEALIALRIAGRVRIQPGVGAYSMANPNETEDGRALSLLAEFESPHEVLELRRVVEEVVLRTLIPDMTAEKLEILEAAFEQLMTASDSGGLDEYFAANRELHLALAAATGNSLLIRLERWILYQMMTEELWGEILSGRLSEMASSVDESVKMLVEDHRAILMAIRNRDTEGAVSRMLRHVGRIEVDAES